MPAPEIIDWKLLNDKTIVYGEPKKNSHHGLTVPLKYKATPSSEPQPIIFQTPVMRAPFGVTDETGEYGRKIEISMSFPGYSPKISTDARGDVKVQPAWNDGTNDIMSKFYSLISGWDGRNEQTAVKNGKAWFGKDISPVVIQELMKRNIKPSTEPEKYSPTFRVKVPVSGKKGEQVPMEEFYDPAGVRIGFDELSRTVRGSRVIALMKTTGLWFAGKSFGMNFQLIQLVRIQNDKFTGCAINIPAHIRSVPADTSDTLKTPPLQIEVDDQPQQKRLCAGNGVQVAS